MHTLACTRRVFACEHMYGLNMVSICARRVCEYSVLDVFMCLRPVCRYECKGRGPKPLLGLRCVNLGAGRSVIVFELFLTYD